MKASRLLVVSGILITSLLVWFAVANYLGAGPVAHAILREQALSLGQAIEAVAARDPSLQTLTGFSSRDIAYFSVLDHAGRIHFHSNSELIDTQVADDRYLALVKAPVLTEERIRLGTGEIVFESQQRLHLPGETLILRLSLHTWQADQIILRARTGLTILLVLTAVAWGLGLLALRLQRRDRLRRDELARHEHLAQLGELGAIVAHEVRNPLAGIKGFAQLLGERLDDPRHQECTAKIVAESERLEKLVNNLLIYVRQEHESTGEAPFTGILRESWDMLADEAARNGVALQVTGEVDRPLACPPDQLRQILLNLFKNALQAMPGGGRVQVIITRDRKQAVIRVADSGPGFAPDELPRIFDPFYTTRASGSGLGLAVCRKLAEGCGGAIAAANCREGGAEITLRLPLAKEPG